MDPSVEASLKEKIYAKVTPSDEEWEAFIQKWRPVSFGKNVIITDFGTVERYFYYVHSGVARGYFIKGGEAFNIGFSYHGDFSGVYDSFVCQKPADYCLETIAPVEALRITYGALMGLFDDYKVFERWGRLFNEMILIGLSVWIKSALSDSAEERFRRLVTQSPQVLQLIPQKHLASYLGMSAETFSRMRKKWRG